MEYLLISEIMSHKYISTFLRGFLTLCLIFEGKCCFLPKVLVKSLVIGVFLPICICIDLFVITLGGYDLQKTSKYVLSCGKIYLFVRFCPGFCVFLCPDCELLAYQRAARPWRTAASELRIRFLFWFFPYGFFSLQASGLVNLLGCLHIFLWV